MPRIIKICNSKSLSRNFGGKWVHDKAKVARIKTGQHHVLKSVTSLLKRGRSKQLSA